MKLDLGGRLPVVGYPDSFRIEGYTLDRHAPSSSWVILERVDGGHSLSLAVLAYLNWPTVPAVWPIDLELGDAVEATHAVWYSEWKDSVNQHLWPEVAVLHRGAAFVPLAMLRFTLQGLLRMIMSEEP